MTFLTEKQVLNWLHHLKVILFLHLSWDRTLQQLASMSTGLRSEKVLTRLASQPLRALSCQHVRSAIRRNQFCRSVAPAISQLRLVNNYLCVYSSTWPRQPDVTFKNSGTSKSCYVCLRWWVCSLYSTSLLVSRYVVVQSRTWSPWPTKQSSELCTKSTQCSRKKCTML